MKKIFFFLFLGLNVSALDFTHMINLIFNKSNTLEIYPANSSIITLNKNEYDTLISNPIKIITKYKQLTNVAFNDLFIYKQKKNNDVYYILSNSQTFMWKPTKSFLKYIPEELVKNFYLFEVSILDQFYSKNNSRLNIIFSVEYSSCHACSPMIMAATIDTKTNTIVIPLQYITQSGNSGTPSAMKHTHLSKEVDGLFLFSLFTAQGFTIAYTELIAFSNNQIKLIFSFRQDGQIEKCFTHFLHTNNNIKTILQNDFQRKKDIISNDYSNAFEQDNGKIIYKNSFCDIFIKKAIDDFPEISKCITFFERINSNIKVYPTKCEKINIKE